MSLNIRDIDPSLIGDSADRTAQWQTLLNNPKIIGQKLDIPAGIYGISGPLTQNRICLCGDGISRTKFKLLANVERPIFSFTGKEAYSSPFGHMSWLSFDEIQFDGNGFAANWFEMKFVAHAYFYRCMWNSTKGTAVRGFSFWDSDFDRCHFAKIDNGVQLLPPGIGNQSYSWSNNITFNTSRFEQIDGTAIDLPPSTRKCRIMSCKFDMVNLCINANGELPNTIVGCQHTHCKTFIPTQVGKKLLRLANIAD